MERSAKRLASLGVFVDEEEQQARRSPRLHGHFAFGFALNVTKQIGATLLLEKLGDQCAVLITNEAVFIDAAGGFPVSILHARPFGFSHTRPFCIINHRRYIAPDDQRTGTLPEGVIDLYARSTARRKQNKQRQKKNGASTHGGHDKSVPGFALTGYAEAGPASSMGAIRHSETGRTLEIQRKLRSAVVAHSTSLRVTSRTIKNLHLTSEITNPVETPQRSGHTS